MVTRRVRTAADLIRNRWDVDPATGCWIWKGKPKKGSGYGQIKVGGRQGKVRYAHVVVWEVLTGRSVPVGHELDHLCRRLICVRPDHLDPVSHQENVLRGTSPSAVNARRAECVHGHPFTDENTYVRPDGAGRHCRTCIRDRKRARGTPAAA